MVISYSLTLVMLSIFVAITGAVTGLTLAGSPFLHRRSAGLALIKGAVVIGVSVWSMHFVAMLAMRFPVAVNYNFVETMVSLYIAMAGAGFALFIVRGQRLKAARLAMGAVFMGGGVVGMHIMAMSALRGCVVEYMLTGMIVAGVVAVVGSALALWIGLRRGASAETLAGGLLLGLLLSTVHFVAMNATSFQYPLVVPRNAVPALTPDVLAAIVAVTTSLIFVVFLYVFAKLAISGAAQRRR